MKRTSALTAVLAAAVLVLSSAAQASLAPVAHADVAMFRASRSVRSGGSAYAAFMVSGPARCSLAASIGGWPVQHSTSVKAERRLMLFSWRVPASARHGVWHLALNCNSARGRASASTPVRVYGRGASDRYLFGRWFTLDQYGMTGSDSGNGGAWPPFGHVLISSSDWFGGHGVPVMSNGTWGCAPSTNPCGDYDAYGIEWQCVELVNRFLEQEGFDPNMIWGNADDVWRNAQDSNQTAYLTEHANGSGYRPVPGDIIVWGGGAQGEGHVSIVNSVSNGLIQWVEQDDSTTGSFTAQLGANGTLSDYGDLYPVGFIHANRNGAPPASPPLQGSSPVLQGGPVNIQGGTTTPIQGTGSGSSGTGGGSGSSGPTPGSGASVSIGWSTEHPSWVTMTLNGFPNGTYTYSCDFGSGGDQSYSITISSDPETVDNGATCWDTESGDTVWVVVHGVTSNTITVPAASSPPSSSSSPPPSQSIQIGWSGAHPSWIWMTLNGFPTGTYTYSCDFASGGDASFHMTETSEPETFDNGETCWDQESGDRVWVTVDGVTSNAITVP